MKKMLKNKKGFSLIELLIVIAIMGVLAVIAFSMFSGVVANSRKKADRTQATNIQKALVAYIVDTGDAALTSLKVNSTDTNGVVTKTATGYTSSAKWYDIVIALQKEQTVDGTVYKPYLNPRDGATPSSVEFKCQWNGHVGYIVDVYPERMNATVQPVETARTNEVIVY
jgi:type IV pilus assembly protein PilA